MAVKTVTMRERKDGSGFSQCCASEENVGKRRCNHTRDSVSFNVQVDKIDTHVSEVIISKDYEKLEKGDKVEIIKKFVSTLEPIDKNTVESVIKEMRNMQ